MSEESFEHAIELLNSLQSNASARNSAASGDEAWRRANFALVVKTMTQLGYPPSRVNELNIIHIAGSKGKGSTAALTASVLSRFLPDGRPPTKIGVFASPHVRTIRERIRIISGPVTEASDWKISEEQFARYFFDIWKVLKRQFDNGDLEELPTFFKCLFAVAIHAFMSEGVDVAILECGIGGEFDATNMVDRPLVSAITTLELEHTELLGNTLKSIAWHKSGIMRPGIPVFTVPQRAEALVELQRRAAEKGAKLAVLDPPASTEETDASGWHTLNAALSRQLALTALLQLRGADWLADTDVESRVLKGLLQKTLPGRFEIREIGNSQWYIDGAHTLQSLEKAAKWFSARTKQANPDSRILLFNQEGRDTQEMLSVLHGELCHRHGGHDASCGLTHVLMCSNAPFRANTFGVESRSMTAKVETNGKAEDFQEKNSRIWMSLCDDPDQQVLKFTTVGEAVEYVREELMTKQKEVHCLATGSLHLVGGLEVVLDEMAKDPSSRIDVPNGIAA